MTMNLRAILTLSLFSISLQAHAQQDIPPFLEPLAEEAVCGATEMESTGTLRYCIQEGDRNHVILMFHGVFNNEDAYQTTIYTNLRKNILKTGKKPTMITMSIGRVMFLNGLTGLNGKSDVQEVIGAIATTLRKTGYGELGRANVDLVGESMGGHNSIMMYLRAPNLFKKFALMCPALTTTSPFVPEVQWLKRMDVSAEWYRSLSFKKAMQFFFGSEQNWIQASPIHFAAKWYLPLKNPGPIFVAQVEKDYFGFNSGDRAFVALMKRKGHVVQESITTGAEHCFIDSESFARFLTAQ